MGAEAGIQAGEVAGMVEDAVRGSLRGCFEKSGEESFCLGGGVGEHGAACGVEVGRWASEVGASFGMKVEGFFCGVTIALWGNRCICLDIGGSSDRGGGIWGRSVVLPGAMFASEEQRGELALIKFRLLIWRF